MASVKEPHQLPTQQVLSHPKPLTRLAQMWTNVLPEHLEGRGGDTFVLFLEIKWRQTDDTFFQTGALIPVPIRASAKRERCEYSKSLRNDEPQ